MEIYGYPIVDSPIFFSRMIHAVGIDHVSLTVNDLKRSEVFYQKIMNFLGVKKQFSEYGFAGWRNSRFNLYLAEAEATLKNESFNRFRVGLNHVAFQAESKKDVDCMYEFLQKNGFKILHAPKILTQTNFSVYHVAFEDPDGIKIEFGYNIE